MWARQGGPVIWAVAATGGALVAQAVALTIAGTNPAVAAEEIAGKVAEVRSGDTIVIAAGQGTILVRLSDIDAPQGSEYFAPGSRALLNAMVGGKDVRVFVAGVAKDGPTFGRVHAGELDVNLEMVKRGAAYVCWDFAVETDYMPWEQRAKNAGVGLWGQNWEIQARGACLRRPPVANPDPSKPEAAK
jgi:micrococcal nuclease